MENIDGIDDLITEIFAYNHSKIVSLQYRKETIQNKVFHPLALSQILGNIKGRTNNDSSCYAHIACRIHNILE